MNNHHRHYQGQGGSTAKEVEVEPLSQKVLSECDREQLHLLGNIQGGAGNVLFVSYPEGKITAADAQVHSVSFIQRQGAPLNAKEGEDDEPSSPRAVAPDELAKDAEAPTRALLGTNLKTWIPAKLNTAIWKQIDGMVRAKSKRVFHFFKWNTNSYAITVHATQDDYKSLGIEIEKVNSKVKAADFYNSLISLGRIIEFYADEKVIKTACDSVFNILGKFDRGMVYKFNDDSSGEVIYEIKKPECLMSSYLGMRFPGADIPLPARQLFVKNGLRYIHDVNAEDIPILQGNGEEQVHLTHCRMRAVSKPHIMYLRNMGVVSSTSIAIVVDNKLWGLLAFHSYTKVFKPHLHQRIACETISSMLSVKIEAIMKKAQSVRIVELSEALMRWKQGVAVSANLNGNGKDILTVLDADVLVAKVQDPSEEGTETIVIGNASLAPGDKYWSVFEEQPRRKILASTTRKELEEMGLSEKDCPATGVVHYSDSLVQIMVGRGLRAGDVIWGGNPDEEKKRVDGFLSPRKSFDRFMEKAKRESRAWSKIDLHVLAAFMERVVEISVTRTVTCLKHNIAEANMKYLDAHERIQDNSSWFAHMSHEIRTPFHGVMGCLNILQDAGSSMPKEEIKDMVDTALVSGNHMLKLLNDILDIAKDKYIAQSIEEVRTNYQTLAAEATHGLRSLAFSNSIEFHSEVLPRNVNSVISTDKTKVVQIVSNLLNNAIKFSEGGRVDVKFQLLDSRSASIEEWSKDAASYGGTIFTMQEHEMFDTITEVKTNILTRPDPAGKKKWLLASIRDSGCGMKANELGDMLRPYTQSSNGSNKVFQGTGLGLFICTSLCRQLHGFIACSSTPNQGTVFHVGIPVGVPNDQSSSTVEVSPQQQLPTTKRNDIVMTGPIAVCDDNKINVKILQRSLKTQLKKRSLEVEVLAAFGGKEIVELYKEQRPSLLFIDYHMPEVDGIEATEIIRQYEKDNGLQPAYILSYTADGTDSAEQNILSRGTNEIMTKPPPKEFLPNLVDRLRAAF